MGAKKFEGAKIRAIAAKTAQVFEAPKRQNIVIEKTISVAGQKTITQQAAKLR